ncbi:hypothetical protein [Mycoplasmopsis gallinacea]|uniref:Uncharacterized protein n=1 Tax=Mycoplasmopsis gallinacea TaxID=29556 RepID=A0A449A211_9BACT|nr:hypothetical protein [Mycoplasmopsis gallinacea]VEU58277.1 Uncharacterised protein [Mycoplasmopsis gallinacea]
MNKSEKRYGKIKKNTFYIFLFSFGILFALLSGRVIPWIQITGFELPLYGRILSLVIYPAIFLSVAVYLNYFYSETYAKLPSYTVLTIGIVSTVMMLPYLQVSPKNIIWNIFPFDTIVVFTFYVILYFITLTFINDWSYKRKQSLPKGKII